MENYLDNTYVISNNTILNYSGNHFNLKVPVRFADIDVLRIGDGSFMESSFLHSVTIPPSALEIGTKAFYECKHLSKVFLPGNLIDIGEKAFSYCDSLSEIVIYGLELSSNDYYSLKGSALKSYEGVYVLREMPENKLVQLILLSLSDAKPACFVSSDISRLFTMDKSTEPKGLSSLNTEISVIGFSVPSVPITESNAFLEHLNSQQTEFYNLYTEEKNDWYVRVDKVPNVVKTIIFTFDDSKTVEDGDRFVITATLKIGYFFWQSSQPVVYDNKQYFVYRRCYLNSEPEMCYVCRDIAVYSPKGLVNNRQEAQRVYEKYKLLSIL